jgi:hypothetical protein
MFFSAAQLSKMSAAQICYVRGKEKKAATPRQIRGDSFAASHTQSHLIEMQSCYSRGDIDIWFTIDEIREHRDRVYIVEHKMAENAEDWFFKSSLIQTAFLGSLAGLAPHLKTARWYDGEENYFTLPVDHHALLNFGGMIYKVNYDVEKVMRFFLTKARASMGYPSARQFDATYKGKEWEFLKDVVKYRKWNRNRRTVQDTSADDRSALEQLFREPSRVNQQSSCYS